MVLKRLVEREWDKGRSRAELERNDCREKRVKMKRGEKTEEAIGVETEELMKQSMCCFMYP